STPNAQAWLNRSTTTSGLTRLDLATRAGDQLTARITGAGRGIRLAAEGATTGTNPQPLKATFEATQDATTRANGTFLTAATQESAAMLWSNVPGGTVSTITAIGGNTLSNIGLVTTGSAPGMVALNTVDKGHYLNLSVATPPPRVNATMIDTRCTGTNQPPIVVYTNGDATGAFMLNYGSSNGVPQALGTSFIDARCDGPLGVNMSLPAMTGFALTPLDCGFHIQMPTLNGVKPTIYAAMPTSNARVEIRAESADPVWNLVLTIGCSHTLEGNRTTIEYTHTGTRPTDPHTDRVKGVDVALVTIAQTMGLSNTTNGTIDCMHIGARCMERMSFSGLDLPRNAWLNLTTKGKELNLNVTGQAGGSLEVRIKVAAGNKSPEEDFVGHIIGQMPLNNLVFLKTDKSSLNGNG